MKTPKRKHCDIYKCEKCGGYGITFTADDTTSALYQCTLCGTCWHMPGLPKRTRAIRARMKRKNREARLRNRIRVDLYHRMMEKCWKDCTMDCLDALTMREDMDGTFGQDIEGS